MIEGKLITNDASAPTLGQVSRGVMILGRQALRVEAVVKLQGRVGYLSRSQYLSVG